MSKCGCYKYYLPLYPSLEEPITPNLHIEREDFPYFRDLLSIEEQDAWDIGTNPGDKLLIDFGLNPDLNYKLNLLWWSTFSDKRIAYKNIQKWWIKLRGKILRSQEPYTRLFKIYENISLELTNSVDNNIGSTTYNTISRSISMGNSKSQTANKSDGYQTNITNSTDKLDAIAQSSGLNSSKNNTSATSDATQAQNNKAYSHSVNLGQDLQTSKRLDQAINESGARQISDTSSDNKSITTGDNINASTITPQSKLEIPFKSFKEGFRGKDTDAPVNEGYATSVNRIGNINNSMALSDSINNGQNYSLTDHNNEMVNNGENQSKRYGLVENKSVAINNNGALNKSIGVNNSSSLQNSNRSSINNRQTVNDFNQSNATNSNTLGYNDNEVNSTNDHINRNASVSVRRVGATEIDLFNNYKQGLGNIYQEYIDEYSDYFLPIYSTD